MPQARLRKESRMLLFAAVPGVIVMEDRACNSRNGKIEICFLTAELPSPLT